MFFLDGMYYPAASLQAAETYQAELRAGESDTKWGAEMDNLARVLKKMTVARLHTARFPTGEGPYIDKGVAKAQTKLMKALNINRQRSHHRLINGLTEPFFLDTVIDSKFIPLPYADDEDTYTETPANQQEVTKMRQLAISGSEKTTLVNAAAPKRKGKQKAPIMAAPSESDTETSSDGSDRDVDENENLDGNCKQDGEVTDDNAPSGEEGGDEEEPSKAGDNVPSSDPSLGPTHLLPGSNVLHPGAAAPDNLNKANPVDVSAAGNLSLDTPPLPMGPPTGTPPTLATSPTADLESPLTTQDSSDETLAQETRTSVISDPSVPIPPIVLPDDDDLPPDRRSASARIRDAAAAKLQSTTTNPPKDKGPEKPPKKPSKKKGATVTTEHSDVGGKEPSLKRTRASSAVSLSTAKKRPKKQLKGSDSDDMDIDDEELAVDLLAPPKHGNYMN
ncbi:hypothetical protein HWV62_6675 [Athelia sp. TMB]|nr:hypothetical protein HWV62_6675 [Athelia sp. TMB]